MNAFSSASFQSQPLIWSKFLANMVAILGGGGDYCTGMNEKLSNLFADSIDTKSAMDAIRDLVGVSNVYIDGKRKSGILPNGILLKNIASYITHMLKVGTSVPRKLV